MFAEVKKHLPGDTLLIDVVRLVVDKTLGLEVPHYEKYFVPGKTKDEEYGCSVDVPLCLKGSNIFVYNQKRNNEMEAQKVKISFGCALLTRSDILHGDY